jgi:hypothetical protein
MVETEAAQRGVLQAILSLHSDGTFTALLEDFYKSVLPKYFALDLPKEPVFNEPLSHPPLDLILDTLAPGTNDRRITRTLCKRGRADSC